MKEKRISFEVGGNKVVGILTTPDSETDKAILLLHGFKGNKDEHGRFTKLIEKLNENSFATLRIDMRGTNESEGRFRDMTVLTEKEDAVAAINYLKEKGYEKIGLVGLSLGGQVSLLANAEQNVDAIVLWAPSIYYSGERHKRGREKELEEKGFIIILGSITGEPWEVGKEFFESVKKVNHPELLKKVRCPILIIHGDKDESVPLEDSKKAISLIEAEKEFKIIPGADHGFFEQLDEFIELTVDWFVKWLK